MKKILLVSLMVCIGILVWVSGASAVSYQYTGNAFTTYDDPPFDSSSYLSMTLSFDNWLSSDYSDSVVLLPGFSITVDDGVRSITSDASDIAGNSWIETDSAGEIVYWNISIWEISTDRAHEMSSKFEVGSGTNYDATNCSSNIYLDCDGLYDYYAMNLENPGTWTRTVVPEPISSTLFLIGGATLGFRRFRKNSKSATTE